MVADGQERAVTDSRGHVSGDGALSRDGSLSFRLAHHRAAPSARPPSRPQSDCGGQQCQTRHQWRYRWCHLVALALRARSNAEFQNA